MGIKIIRVFIAIIGLLMGYQWTYDLMQLDVIGFAESPLIHTAGSVVGALLIGLIFYLITPALIRRITYVTDSVDVHIRRVSLHEILIGTLGMVSGLIVANLLTFALLKIPFVGAYLPILVNILFGYLGISIAWAKRGELTQVIPWTKSSTDNAESGGSYKVLDTSAIIDGRIADIASAGFIEGIMAIPTFVLLELQHIADSPDSLRRARGRRGLDVLKRMQKELDVEVEILEQDFEEVTEVDSKLVRLAQTLKGKVITNDYNLNKICELQGVPVLNINELANAVKPNLLPGEEMNVQIIKEGKEQGQGIGYLEDGTMIVVEEGRHRIGQSVAVVVTSVLQTAAGRMIFARVKK